MWSRYDDVFVGLDRSPVQNDRAVAQIGFGGYRRRRLERVLCFAESGEDSVFGRPCKINSRLCTR